MRHATAVAGFLVSVALGVAVATITSGGTAPAAASAPHPFLDEALFAAFTAADSPANRRAIISQVAAISEAVTDAQSQSPLAKHPRCVAAAEKWIVLATRGSVSDVHPPQKIQLLSVIGNVWQRCLGQSLQELLFGATTTAQSGALNTVIDAAVHLHRQLKKSERSIAEAAFLRLVDATAALIDAAPAHSALHRSGLGRIARAAVAAVRANGNATATRRLLDESVRLSSGRGNANAGGVDAPVPFWQFIPALAGRAVPGGPAVSMATRCFDKVTVTAAVEDASKHEIKLTIDALNGAAAAKTKSSKSLCAETLLLYAGGAFSLDLALWEQLWHEQKLKVDDKKHEARDHGADWWDATTNGVRVFYSVEPLVDTIVSFVETFMLIVGPTVSYDTPLSDATQLDAMMMLNSFTPLSPQIFGPLPPDPPMSAAEVAATTKTGDILASLRLDGFETFFSFLQSENVGSVAVAVCPPSSAGGCLICESRPQSNYWLSANGVQCHDAATWFELAQNVSLNVVRMPLTDELQQRVNANAAMAAATNELGVDYGYQNWGFAWTDVAWGNMPCLPMTTAVPAPQAIAQSTHCVSWDIAEVVFAMVDKVLPPLAAYWVGEGLNNRLPHAHKGEFPGPIVTRAFMLAKEQLGLNATEFLAIPERDDWPYYSTRDGEIYNGTVYSASKYACEVLRAAGAFPSGLDFECGELTNSDLTGLALFNATTTRQVAGSYRVFPAPQPNARAPFANMSQTCASASNPMNGFLRESGC